MEEEKKEKGSALQAWLNRKNKASRPASIQALDEKTPTVLSFGQQRLWLLQQLFPDNPFYQYSHLYRFRGLLDIDRLEAAFGQVIQRHAILRTGFQQMEDGIRQAARAYVPPKIIQHDLSHLHQSEARAAAEEKIKSISKRPFDLNEPPLLRLNLLKLSQEEHWLLLDIHHIIGDRWSLELINSEVAEYYRSFEQEQTHTPTALPFQYADYARHQQARGIDEKDLAFWRKELAGELPVLALPHDFGRPSEPRFRGATIHRQLTATLSDQLKQLSKAQETTPFTLLLAAFKTLLFRYTGQEDILVGSPFSNRDRLELEQLVGFFNETLILRSAVSADLPFTDLVSNLKGRVLQALPHKNLPFDALVRELQQGRDGHYNPLFQAMFLYNTPVSALNFGEQLQVVEEMVNLQVAKFDLTLFVNEKEEGLKLSMEYDTALFKPRTVNQLLEHFEQLLIDVAEHPNTALGSIKLLPDAEQQHIINILSGPSHPQPTVAGIHQLFEQQAQVNPNKTAVAAGQESFTYQALNEQADRLARQLIAEGVKTMDVVGLYCDRTASLFVGMLGILKAGAAYLPLDPNYPEERIRFMLDDAGVKWIVTRQVFEGQLPADDQQHTIFLDTPANNTTSVLPLPPVTQDANAYVIYTSGSTGRPKGVTISHRNLIHSTTARFDFYPEAPSSFLLLSSFAFDSSVAGIFWTLCSGGTLVLPPKRIEQDMHTLAELIKTQSITHTLLLPSLYHLLLRYGEAADLHTLQCVIVAGEACPSSLVAEHFRSIPQARLYNEYGPTEATVWCIAHEIKPEDTEGPVPIGRPISNMQALILDSGQQVVPVGVAGELYITGRGISSGYLNRPALTKERFLPVPFAAPSAEKMYKTGDLVRLRDDGVLEYLGRTDHQLKIRGYRVEPEEIANQLLKEPGIHDAVVIANKSNGSAAGTLSLIAYVTGIEEEGTLELKRSLSRKLPAYMVPTIILALTELPRLPNGKINRQALPAPEEGASPSTITFQPPNTPLEEQLAAIWEEVLNRKSIGIHANFFEIGGDSLLSIQVVSRARKQGIELAPNQLFQHQTIAELAASMEGSSEFSSLVALRAGGTQAPFFCIHSGGAHVHFYQAFAQYLSEDRPVYALQPAGLADDDKHDISIEEMATDYIEEIRRVQARGPYHILGTCFSNAVALEMSNQLTAVGEQVDLYIIDSAPLHLMGDDAQGGNATLRRFLDLLGRGDFSRIKHKVLNRIRPQQKSNATWEAVSADDELRALVEGMNRAYARYSWSSFPGKIRFIRSSEFHGRPDKKFHLQQWHKLAGGGLEVHVVPGHHLTLFQEPEVKGLAHKIDSCLSKATA